VELYPQGLQLPLSAQIRKVDQKRAGIDHRAEGSKEKNRGLRGSTGGHQVIHQKHPLSFFDAILVEFERAGSVFEGVFPANGFRGKFSRLSDRDKSGTQKVRHHSAKNKTPSLNPRHQFRGTAFKRSGHSPAGVAQALGMAEQGGDIAEQDSFFGVVWNVADVLEKWVGRHGVSIIGMVATAGKGSPLAMEIHGSTAGKTCGILAGMSVQIHTNKEGKATVVQLQGKVDATSAPSVEQALVGAIEQGEKKLVIDCASLDFISSAGLRSLLLAVKKMKAAGGQIALAALQPHVKEVFDISGFSSLFVIHGSKADAIK